MLALFAAVYVGRFGNFGVSSGAQIFGYRRTDGYTEPRKQTITTIGMVFVGVAISVLLLVIITSEVTHSRFIAYTLTSTMSI